MFVGDVCGTFVLEPSIDRELPNPSDTVAAQATPHGQGRLPYLLALHHRWQDWGRGRKVDCQRRDEATT